MCLVAGTAIVGAAHLLTATVPRLDFAEGSSKLRAFFVAGGFVQLLYREEERGLGIED